MGDVAEMMLDGTLCERCGVYIGNPDGYPKKCKPCKKEDNLENHAKYLLTQKKVECPTCKKKIKPAGLADHIRDKHGA
jgi:hypothetical protein